MAIADVFIRQLKELETDLITGYLQQQTNKQTNRGVKDQKQTHSCAQKSWSCPNNVILFVQGVPYTSKNNVLQAPTKQWPPLSVLSLPSWQCGISGRPCWVSPGVCTSARGYRGEGHSVAYSHANDAKANTKIGPDRYPPKSQSMMSLHAHGTLLFDSEMCVGTTTWATLKTLFLSTCF